MSSKLKVTMYGGGFSVWYRGTDGVYPQPMFMYEDRSQKKKSVKLLYRIKGKKRWDSWTVVSKKMKPETWVEIEWRTA